MTLSLALFLSSAILWNSSWNEVTFLSDDAMMASPTIDTTLLIWSFCISQCASSFLNSSCSSFLLSLRQSIYSLSLWVSRPSGRLLLFKFAMIFYSIWLSFCWTVSRSLLMEVLSCSSIEIFLSANFSSSSMDASDRLSVAVLTNYYFIFAA